MKFRVAALLLLANLSLSAHGQNSASPKYPPAVMFKNYALSSCIASAYTSDEVKKDASASASGYLELGAGPLEAYTEATQLGRKFLARHYEGMADTSFNMMKCIDFYHSKELDALAKKYFK